MIKKQDILNRPVHYIAAPFPAGMQIFSLRIAAVTGWWQGLIRITGIPVIREVGHSSPKRGKSAGSG
jgi:hypothetical protein